MALPVTVAPAARDAAIASLSQLLGDRLSTAEFVREQHGKGASYHPCVPPDAVAFAQSTEEVSQIVKLRAEHKVPIILLAVARAWKAMSWRCGAGCVSISRGRRYFRRQQLRQRC